jgi:hypothetical protein
VVVTATDPRRAHYLQGTLDLLTAVPQDAFRDIINLARAETRETSD